MQNLFWKTATNGATAVSYDAVNHIIPLVTKMGVYALKNGVADISYPSFFGLRGSQSLTSSTILSMNNESGKIQSAIIIGH